MQRKQEIPDDLDYLAELGFEAVPTTAAEIESLKKAVAGAGKAGGLSVYLMLVAFLGVNVFFARYNRDIIWPTQANEAEAQPVQATSDSLPETMLDEVLVLPGRHTVKTSSYTFQDTVGLLNGNDTLSIVPLSSRLETDSLPSGSPRLQLKPLINSDILFIHDLKVSDYRNLYFKRSVSNNLPGVPAAFSEKQTARVGGLKQEAAVYLHTEFSEALLLFKKQRWSECAHKLQQIAYYNKEDVNCSFYLGLCLYQRKNYAMALTHFEECLQSRNNAFAEEAKFYKALCLLESGNNEAAITLLEQIREAGGFYSTRAETYLR